ncbi:MAG: hypothetical protein ACI9LL_000538, partial [Porticoccus sp.]
TSPAGLVFKINTSASVRPLTKNFPNLKYISP